MKFVFVEGKGMNVWSIFEQFVCKMEKVDEKKFKVKFMFLKNGYKYNYRKRNLIYYKKKNKVRVKERGVISNNWIGGYYIYKIVINERNCYYEFKVVYYDNKYVK